MQPEFITIIMTIEEYDRLVQRHPELRLPELRVVNVPPSRERIFVAYLILNLDGGMHHIDLSEWRPEELRALRAAVIMAGAVPASGLRFSAESADLEPDLTKETRYAQYMAPFNGRGNPTLHPMKQ